MVDQIFYISRFLAETIMNIIDILGFLIKAGVIGILIIFGIYVLVRIAAYAATKSFYQVKLNQETNGDNKQPKETENEKKEQQ